MGDACCSAPGREPGTRCGRQAWALGLCRSHYMWRRRHPGEPLRPLGLPREERQPRRVVQVRVTAEILAALRAASETQGYRDRPDATAASKALEEWAEWWRSRTPKAP